jgi:hypothetical protein
VTRGFFDILKNFIKKWRNREMTKREMRTIYIPSGDLNHTLYWYAIAMQKGGVHSKNSFYHTKMDEDSEGNPLFTLYLHDLDKGYDKDLCTWVPETIKAFPSKRKLLKYLRKETRRYIKKGYTL